jgi:hypothetical protein
LIVSLHTSRRSTNSFVSIASPLFLVKLLEGSGALGTAKPSG